jgi:hypothetical protein
MVGRVLVCSLLAGVASFAASEDPPVTRLDVSVQGDAVTADLTRAPVAQVLAAIAEQAGAEVRGEVAGTRDVTLTLEHASFEDALERLLGEQSFTLTYRAGGGLKRITLGGTAVAKGASRPAGPVTAGGPGPAPWPPTPEAAEAVRRVAEFMHGNPTVPVNGRLAQTLGTRTSTFMEVLQAGLKHDDAHVRAEGRRVVVRSLAADPEVRAAMVTTFDSMDDERLVQALRSAAGVDAERLALAFARHGRSPVLARRMHRAREQLRAPGAGS